MYEIGKEMSIEGCYCGLSVICELNDHAMSGTALPERLKEGYLSVILELRNSCTTKTWNASVYFLIICFVKRNRGSPDVRIVQGTFLGPR